MKHLFVLIVFFLSFATLAQQNTPQLNNVSYVTTFSEIDEASFVNTIKRIGKEAQIVGLGEVSHYTKECYQLKSVAIETLMKQGYAGLVLEVDFGQAVLWNDYVVKGEGDVQTLLESSGWFTYRTEEFKTLLEKIRQYNGKATNKFQIFGMEMTAMHNNIDWLRDYLIETKLDTTALLGLLNKERQIVAFNQYNQEQCEDYWNLYYSITSFLNTNEQLLINANNSVDYEIAKQIAEITRQYATYISQDDFRLKTEFRDQFSARNIGWVLSQLPDNTKLVLWAHNGHIAKTSPMFNYNVVGHYLQRWFGDTYVAIGFTFNSGSFGAFSNSGFKKWNIDAAGSKSLTYNFSQLKTPFAFFDVRQALSMNTSTDFYFRKPVTIRTDISESFSEIQNKMMPLNISETYDALIYIENTSYPSTIPFKQKK